MAEPRKKKSRKAWWIVAVLLVAGAAGTGAYLKRSEKPILVQTEKVSRRSLTEFVVASGRIQPVVQVKISPEVSGEIIDLPVKEGQQVKKGDLLVRIRPDFYAANHRSAQAAYRSAEAGQTLAEANLRKAESDFKRNQDLLTNELISASVYMVFKTALDVARASCRSAEHQVDVARASLDRATEELSKTTIVAPIDGTVSRLNSQAGERVVGTAMMTGTEIMMVADLNEMEARVEIGEIDVVLIATGQKARLEVDAFRDRKFGGTVTEIANSSRGADRNSPGSGMGGGGGGQSQEATRFEVRIRIAEREVFRPGMSVSAEIETRSRTNVLTVPIQSVTTRLPKTDAAGTNSNTGTNASASAKTNAAPHASSGHAKSRDKSGGDSLSGPNGKSKDENKPIEVVFLFEGGIVRARPVTRGISDDNFTEITAGVQEGEEVISGGYKAISRDLEDGKKVTIGVEPAARRP
jgi:HlyD family secretion protein